MIIAITITLAGILIWLAGYAIGFCYGVMHERDRAEAVERRKRMGLTKV